MPLDHINGTYPGDTISIAIAKLPARVPIDDPRYGGPILLNPGGPGGAGAAFAVAIAESLQIIVDSELEPETPSEDGKYYDLIGFDPRGIGFTEPGAFCMPDQPAEWSWALREATEGLLGSSDAALGRLWSMTHAWGTSCRQAEDSENGPDIKKYMSTAFVARDMLEIVERHAEYIKHELSLLRGIKSGGKCNTRKHDSDVHEVKLNYWGFSYGTFLGSTFASMFPDRIGRVILDAVVSSYDYNHSLGNGSLTDSEKVMESFYTYCQAAGTAGCPLAIENGTASDIRDRFSTIVKSLYHNPLPLITPAGPDILTWSDVKMLIFSSLYGPQRVFPFIAAMLAAVEVGHGEALDDLSLGFRYLHTYTCSKDETSNHVPLLGTPTIAVLCGDGIDQTHEHIEDFAEYWHLLESISPTAGAYWSMLRMRCSAWKIKTSYAFQGPFGGRTSNPILFLSNTADPVTPLRSGRLMHSMFENSGILVQDSAGHCSMSTPTPCTLAYIRVGRIHPLMLNRLTISKGILSKWYTPTTKYRVRSTNEPILPEQYRPKVSIFRSIARHDKRDHQSDP